MKNKGKSRFLYADFAGKPCAACKYAMTLLFGGIGYGLIEILWRGRTHPSMVLCGGLCFLFMHTVNAAMRKHSVFLRALICMAGITAMEFAVGCIVNIALGMGVWDYSGMRFQLMGQICLLYSFFWYLLSVAVSFASNIAFRLTHSER